jgi:hypothetical protein
VYVNDLACAIEDALRYLESAEPEDDGLTEFPMAVTPESMCYVDAETAIIILYWVKSLI